MSLLTQYVIALSHLYGLVHKDKVIQIYNSQNKDTVNKDDIEAILNNPPKELEDKFVLIHKDYFVMETIIDYNYFDLLLNNKADKPYYIPVKDELLKYTEDSYFEKSKQYNNLVSYLQKNFLKLGDIKAELLAEDIQGMCQFGLGMDAIFDSFKRMNVILKDIDQANEVMLLVMDLSNNIRIWDNNGHTPNELFEMVGKSNSKPLTNKPVNFDEPNTINMKARNKIGRNDPCPCGSVKKYKNCCLKKKISLF